MTRLLLGCVAAAVAAGACEAQDGRAGPLPVLLTVAVESDDDLDHALSPGEHARLAVTVRNDGDTPVLGARLWVVSKTPTLRIVDGTPVTCGHVQPGATATCGGPYQWTPVELDAAAVVGSSLGLAISLSDEAGGSWSFTAAVPVAAPSGRPPATGDATGEPDG